MKKIEIKRKTLASIAYDSIKAGIVSGEINNNLLLSENTLAKILNMSRTPIREAIKRLEAEKLFKKCRWCWFNCSRTFIKGLSRNI